MTLTVDAEGMLISQGERINLCVLSGSVSCMVVMAGL